MSKTEAVTIAMSTAEAIEQIPATSDDSKEEEDRKSIKHSNMQQ
jgi:hypothetical protein